MPVVKQVKLIDVIQEAEKGQLVIPSFQHDLVKEGFSNLFKKN